MTIVSTDCCAKWLFCQMTDHSASLLITGRKAELNNSTKTSESVQLKSMYLANASPIPSLQSIGPIVEVMTRCVCFWTWELWKSLWTWAWNHVDRFPASLHFPHFQEQVGWGLRLEITRLQILQAMDSTELGMHWKFLTFALKYHCSITTLSIPVKRKLFSYSFKFPYSVLFAFPSVFFFIFTFARLLWALHTVQGHAVDCAQLSWGSRFESPFKISWLLGKAWPSHIIYL